jgi:chorismate synthase
MSVLGRIFRVTTFGESHSRAVGCVVEGYPGGCRVDLDFIQSRLDRRKPGQSVLTTQRVEADRVTCLSGVEQGVALGSPITLLVQNGDTKPRDYDCFKDVPRPGHADFTYLRKYGVKALSGGGRSSARETVGRVCAGALA